MIGTNILLAKKLLEQGELVAIPTETVYGLAANALHENAVLRIFQVKNRPTFDPLIIHTDSFEKLTSYVSYIPEKAKILAAQLMPGALTLLLPKQNNIPDLVTSGLPLVAVRIPQHPLALQLLASIDFPLAAPSANPFGYISPTTALHVEAQLGSKIPYILDGGKSKIGLESTIVGFEQDQLTVFRKGGISIETIEQLVGKVKVQAHSSSNPQAPGMLKSHYAPKTPFFLGNIAELVGKHSKKYKKIGLLAFATPYPAFEFAAQELLSPTQNFEEAAHHLFAAMRHLDSLSLDAIFAELLPEKDLGRAINDRLRRAAAH
jgi:L-threonylcarbamoyladenylate synthase